MHAIALARGICDSMAYMHALSTCTRGVGPIARPTSCWPAGGRTGIRGSQTHAQSRSQATAQAQPQPIAPPSASFVFTAYAHAAPRPLTIDTADPSLTRTPKQRTTPQSAADSCWGTQTPKQPTPQHQPSTAFGHTNDHSVALVRTHTCFLMGRTGPGSSRHGTNTGNRTAITSKNRAHLLHATTSPFPFRGFIAQHRQRSRLDGSQRPHCKPRFCHARSHAVRHLLSLLLSAARLLHCCGRAHGTHTIFPLGRRRRQRKRRSARPTDPDSPPPTAKQQSPPAAAPSPARRTRNGDSSANSDEQHKQQRQQLLAVRSGQPGSCTRDRQMQTLLRPAADVAAFRMNGS